MPLGASATVYRSAGPYAHLGTYWGHGPRGRVIAELRKSESAYYQTLLRADARTRTGDPFITSEVLYQLSYVGDRRWRV